MRALRVGWAATVAACAGWRGAGGACAEGDVCAAYGPTADGTRAGPSAVHVDKEELCVMDEMTVRWNAVVPRVAGSFAIYGIQLVDATSGHVLRHVAVEDERLVPWETQREALRLEFEAYVDTVPVVGCQVLSEWEMSEEACGDGSLWPRIISAAASEGYGPGSNLTTLRFDRDTDQVDVSSDAAVRAVVAMSASIGKELTGKWVDPRTLVITVVDDEGRSDYHEQGVTLQLKRRPRRQHERRYASMENLMKSIRTPGPGEALELSGELAFVVGYATKVQVQLLVLDPENPEALSRPATVSSCSPGKSAILVAPSTAAAPGAKSLGGGPQPVWHLEDRVVMEASKFKLPRIVARGRLAESRYDVFEPAEWSLSFWVALAPRDVKACKAEPSTNFRALLYHGQGRGHEQGERTPSLWLFPHDNRLALRISTGETSDFGLDSVVELPEKRWAHVVLVFKDEGEAEEEDEDEDEDAVAMFRAKVFLDGEEVILLEHPSDEVATSAGWLHFGHDAWLPGPSGFVEDLRLYDVALSRLEIAQHIAASRLGPAHARDAKALFPDPVGAEDCPFDAAMDAELVAEAEATDSLRTARELLESAAMDGAPDALFALSELEEIHGDAFGPRRRELLEGAASRGHADASFQLALWDEVAPFFSGEETGEQVDAGRERLMRHLERAALLGSLEAKLALANELRLAGKCRAALFYYQQGAAEAFDEHTSGGKEPLVEMQALSDYVSEVGEHGEDDEHIQYQEVRAEQGDVEAMMAMGGLLYWGARGLERDQPRALRYFERAAATGHAPAQTAVGNMLLKGEGAPKNRTRALELYKLAAAQDNLEALNGLGFLYYFGDGNLTRDVGEALKYFELNLRDGDSVFNAAHIYMNEPEFRDVRRAAQLLERAANEFGNFAAAFALGELYATRDGGGSACRAAMTYARIAALRGSRAGVLRRGFDAFLERRMDRSARHYLQAAVMGYSRGAENAAWLLHSKLGSLGRGPHARVFRRIDAPKPPLQALLQGDLLAATGDAEAAARLWAVASSAGDWSEQPVYRSQASYNLGVRAMAQRRWALAERYFARAERVLEGDKSDEAEAARVPLALARWRLRAARYVHPALADLF